MARKPRGLKILLPTEAEVWAFCSRVPIATKDLGLTTIQPWGTQKALLRAILAGTADGIRQFIVLKARQVGATSFLLLLTLLWMSRFPGLQGLTVADSEENLAYFRDLILGMMETLPEGSSDLGIPDLRTRNRIQMTWQNQSRLLLQTAGPRTWKRLGVGRGLSFHHGSEVPLWGNGNALSFLRAAFSDLHPAALYVFEGTARGRNWYMDLWDDAADATTMRQVFLGWWLREDNAIPKTDRRFKHFWDDRLTPRELEWHQELQHPPFQISLKPTQWAWRRWYILEKAGGSERLADQEQPTIPSDAFGASQERPFLERVSGERVRHGVATAPTASTYIYHWASQMEDTRAEPTPPGVPPLLTVWQLPDGGPVVVAAIPAYSAMEDDPTWVVSVWQAAIAEDRLTQVAEFATDAQVGLQPFAWVCLHLAGCYQASHRAFILEVSGLGSAVLQEIKRLVSTGWGTSRKPEFKDLVGSIRHYVWRRPDSLVSGGALQWKSSPEIQGGVLQRLRDQIIRGVVTVRSPQLAEELTRLEAEGDTFKPGGREPHGHRAMAAALAVESWSAQLYPYLKRARAIAGSASTVQGRIIQGFVSQLVRPA